MLSEIMTGRKFEVMINTKNRKKLARTVCKIISRLISPGRYQWLVVGINDFQKKALFWIKILIRGL